MGAIKKDIIFSGDVLNVTARIQELCKPHHTEMLISGYLLNKMDTNDKFTIKALGQHKLRGRDEVIELYTVAANG